jgi:transposase
MYQVAMYYTIKTLLSQGKSIREIARELGMCRKTISRIKTALDNGNDRPAEQVRTKILDGYKDVITEYFEDGLTALLIHRRLTTEKGLAISYPSVARWVEGLKKQEVYIPCIVILEQNPRLILAIWEHFVTTGPG